MTESGSSTAAELTVSFAPMTSARSTESRCGLTCFGVGWREGCGWWVVSGWLRRLESGGEGGAVKEQRTNAPKINPE
jgi:hypothetical protein